MIRLLDQRYTRIRNGADADRFVRARHPRCPYRTSGISYGVAGSIADYIAIDTYGMSSIIGHEVKVSRSDWLAELRNPRKAQRWMEYCTHWYLVCPTADIVRDDLPDGWGLMVIGKNGRLRVAKSAPVNEQQVPMPTMVMAQLARAVSKTSRIEVAEASS